MDVRFINPFIESVKNVYSTMLSTDLLVSRPRVKRRDEPLAEVSAIIGVSGDVVGTVALCFSANTAERTATALAGTLIDRHHPDFGDALGEIANMVAGRAKARFDGVDASISLPKVITGRDMRLLDDDALTLVLPCDSALGRFTTEVSLMPTTVCTGIGDAPSPTPVA